MSPESHSSGEEKKKIKKYNSIYFVHKMNLKCIKKPHKEKN